MKIFYKPSEAPGWYNRADKGERRVKKEIRTVVRGGGLRMEASRTISTNTM